MKDNSIAMEESPRSYYTMIPNYVDDLGLTVYAYRLYGHLRRVAGETGACWQSTATLAKTCRMSQGSVSKHKQELVDVGLIKIEVRHNDKGQYHHITITDIWRKNSMLYADSPDEVPSSPGELGTVGSSPGESPTPRGSSPGETKKNQEENKNHIIKSESPDGRAWFLSLAALCDIDLAIATKRQKQQLGQSSKLLKDKAGATPEQIEAFGSWWYADDWRGQKGQPPTPAQVREVWGRFKKSASKSRIRMRSR